MKQTYSISPLCATLRNLIGGGKTLIFSTLRRRYPFCSLVTSLLPIALLALFCGCGRECFLSVAGQSSVQAKPLYPLSQDARVGHPARHFPIFFFLIMYFCVVATTRFSF